MADVPSSTRDSREVGMNRPVSIVTFSVLCTALLGAAFQGSRGLYETTEGRYAEAALETLLSGRLLEPTLNGKPHWTKPPLTYWAIAAGLRLFGHNTWGVRAYLVLAWVVLVASIDWAGGVLWGRRAGALSALIAATTPMFAAAAHVVSTDLLLTTWAALTVALFFHGLQFYLRRKIPAVSSEEVVRTLEASSAPCRRACLVKRGKWSDWREIFPENPRLHAVGPHWLLVETGTGVPPSNIVREEKMVSEE